MFNRWTAPDLAFLELGGNEDAVQVADFIELEPASNCLQSRTDVDLPSCLSATECALAKCASTPVHPLGYYALPDITLQGSGYLWQNRRICSGPEIQQTFVREKLLQHSDLISPGKKFRIRRLRSPALVFTGWDYNNFGHWCMDILPRLGALYLHDAKLLRQLKIVLPGNVRSEFVSMLKTLFGIGEKNLFPYCPDTEVVRLKSAIVPTMAHRDYRYHPAISRFFELISDRFGQPGSTKEKRELIYVSRAHYANNSRLPKRLLTNTSEIEYLAKSYGFHKIEPQMFPWRQQVELFAHSKVVIGEHGSAMKNLLFAPSGVRSVVLNYLNETQCSIAAIRQQIYVPVTSEEFDEHQFAKRPYRIDISKVEACLSWALGSI